MLFTMKSYQKTAKEAESNNFLPLLLQSAQRENSQYANPITRMNTHFFSTGSKLCSKEIYQFLDFRIGVLLGNVGVNFLDGVG